MLAGHVACTWKKWIEQPRCNGPKLALNLHIRYQSSSSWGHRFFRSLCSGFTYLILELWALIVGEIWWRHRWTRRDTLSELCLVCKWKVLQRYVLLCIISISKVPNTGDQHISSQTLHTLIIRLIVASSRLCYVVLTTVWAIPTSILWGCAFASISFSQVWCVTPFCKALIINTSCIKRWAQRVSVGNCDAYRKLIPPVADLASKDWLIAAHVLIFLSLFKLASFH